MEARRHAEDPKGIHRAFPEYLTKDQVGYPAACGFDEEICMSIGEEVARLLAMGFIREINHPVWIVNPVLVKKKIRS